MENPAQRAGSLHPFGTALRDIEQGKGDKAPPGLQSSTSQIDAASQRSPRFIWTGQTHANRLYDLTGRVMKFATEWKSHYEGASH